MTPSFRFVLLMLLASLAGAAKAQPAKWDGLYLGAQGGSSWAKSTWNTSAYLLTSTDEHIENNARDWGLGAQLGYWHDEPAAPLDGPRSMGAVGAGRLQRGGFFVKATEFQSKIDLLLRRLTYTF
jgi:hypothetical protein